MNCRPGDLAFIIRARDQRIVGRIVEVLDWIDCDAGGKSGWAVDFISTPAGLPDAWHLHSCPDASLRPIHGLPVQSKLKKQVRT